MTSLQHEEYVLQTYTGSLISFTTGNQTVSLVPGAGQGPAIASDADRQARMMAEQESLEAEISSLQARIEVCSPHCTEFSVMISEAGSFYAESCITPGAML